MSLTEEDIKAAAEADLVTFIKLIAPQTVLGSVHIELCRWWTRQEAKQFQLILLLHLNYLHPYLNTF